MTFVVLAVVLPEVTLVELVVLVTVAGVWVQVPLASVKLVWQRVQAVLVQFVQFMLH